MPVKSHIILFCLFAAWLPRHTVGLAGVRLWEVALKGEFSLRNAFDGVSNSLQERDAECGSDRKGSQFSSLAVNVTLLYHVWTYICTIRV